MDGCRVLSRVPEVVNLWIKKQSRLLAWDLTRCRCRGPADRPTPPPTTALRRRPVLILLLGPLPAVWALDYATSPLDWNIRMASSLGSGGDASLDEGMSTACPRLEAQETLLARRHQVAWQAWDIDSRPTFRQKYDHASGPE